MARPLSAFPQLPMRLGVAKVDWMARPMEDDAASPGQTARDGSSLQAKVPAADDEAPLLPRVARHEPGAVEAFIDRYGGAIWNLSRRLCRSRADTEDATQDVFVELWRHAGRFDASAGGEWTFVLTIARRRLIDRLRRTSRRRDVATGDVGPSDAGSPDRTPDPAAGPYESAETTEATSVAVAALDRLSPDQQTVLRLSTFEGLSYPEISERLGMPLGTVKTHARRGLIRLRQLLNAPEPDESRADF